MGTIAAIPALLRRVRVERPVLLLLFGLTAVTGFVVVAGPRLFDRVADVGLRSDLAGASATQRDLEFQSIGQPDAIAAESLEAARERATVLASQIPPSVRALTGPAVVVIDTARFRLAKPPNYTTVISFRSQTDADRHVTLVAGRFPARAARTSDPAIPFHLEVAVSQGIATETKLRVGDTYEAVIDPSDPLLSFVFPRPTTRIAITVVGIFAIPHPDEAYWFDDTRLAGIRLGGTFEFPIAYASALVAPEAYPDLVAFELPVSARWRFEVDPSTLDASRLTALVPDLRGLTAEFATTANRGGTALHTGLPALVGRFQARQATAASTLSVAAVGPLAVAAGALGIVALLVIRGRRSQVVLARSRGASSAQLLATQLVEGLLVGVPAALLGLAVAVGLVPGRASGLELPGAALVAGAAALVLVAASWSVSVRPRGRLAREDRSVSRLTPRRLVLDGLAVAVASIGAILLRERGIGGVAGGSGGLAGPSGAASTGADPLLALTPALIGAAVGLVAIRAYPLPLRALGWTAARRRDLVPVLALRDAGRHPSGAYLPLLVLTVTIALGTFASVVSVTIERDQVAASWQSVGADYRVETQDATALAPAVDPSVVPGVDAVARGRVVDGSSITAGGLYRTFGRLLAVDPSAYEQVVAGAPLGDPIPFALTVPPPTAGAGSTDQPIPAVLSSRLATSVTPAVAVGDTIIVEALGRKLSYLAVAVVDSFPGMTARSSFVVAPFAWVAAGFGEAQFAPSVFFVRGDATIGERLRATIRGQSGAPVVVSRAEAYASVHDAPLVAGVVTGFVASFAVAAGYAALAIVAGVILDGQRRAREIGFLRTLGVTDRQVAGMTIVEHGLPTAVAVVVGVALGLGVTQLLAPGLALEAFIGPDAVVRIEVDPVVIVVLALVVVAVVAAAVAASTWLARRLDLGRILRLAEE